MPEDSSAVWPFDILWPIQPSVGQAESGKPHGGSTLTCFLIQPSEPKGRSDSVYLSVQKAVLQVNDLMRRGPGETAGYSDNDAGLTFRASASTQPGVIQREIFESIRDAEVVVADITECRHNVMYELGAAAAIKGVERIILLRDAEVPGEHPFDLSPARYFEYERSPRGFDDLVRKLRRPLCNALTRALLERATDSLRERVDPRDLPVDLDLTRNRDSPHLVAPTDCHRACGRDGLEFGRAGNIYRSWLAVSSRQLRDAELEIEVRPEHLLTDDRSRAWVGVALRKTSPLANDGYLLYVRGSGEVQITLPLRAWERRGDGEWDYADRHVRLSGSPPICAGGICGCAPTLPSISGQWLGIRLRAKEDELTMSVKNLDTNEGIPEKQVRLAGDFVSLNRGWAMIQCWWCQATIRNMKLTSA